MSIINNVPLSCLLHIIRELLEGGGKLNKIIVENNLATIFWAD